MKANGDRGLSAFEVESQVNRLIEKLENIQAPVYVSARNRVQAILEALEMLKIRRLVVETEGIFKAIPEESDILSYYANSIVHWMGPEREI